MKFLITNDDGIDAPGIDALARAVDGLGQPAVVAPRDPQSGISHQITMSGPMRLDRIAAKKHSLAGTPADCVRVALTELAIEPDWVLAGINRGGNLGADVYTSGTVAAAREAALFRRPAIAISQYVAVGRYLDWDLSARRARRILLQLLERPLSDAAFWNINLPHPEHEREELTVRFCPPDTSPLDVHYKRDGEDLYYAGNYHGRPRQPDRDVDVCFRGEVAISEIHLEPGQGR